MNHLYIIWTRKLQQFKIIQTSSSHPPFFQYFVSAYLRQTFITCSFFCCYADMYSYCLQELVNSVDMQPQWVYSPKSLMFMWQRWWSPRKHMILGSGLFFKQTGHDLMMKWLKMIILWQRARHSETLAATEGHHREPTWYYNHFGFYLV